MKAKKILPTFLLILLLSTITQFVNAQTQIENNSKQKSITGSCNCSSPGYGCTSNACRMYCSLYCRRHHLSPNEIQNDLSNISITNIGVDALSHLITIEVPSAKESTLQVYDQIGNLVHEEKFYLTAQLDEKNFTSGVYAFKWNDGEVGETTLISVLN